MHIDIIFSPVEQMSLPYKNTNTKYQDCPICLHSIIFRIFLMICNTFYYVRPFGIVFMITCFIQTQLDLTSVHDDDYLSELDLLSLPFPCNVFIFCNGQVPMPTQGKLNIK